MAVSIPALGGLSGGETGLLKANNGPGKGLSNRSIPAGGHTGAPGGASPSAAENGEGGKDEYKSPVSAMLKQVHGLLGKSGKGLPGFSQVQPSGGAPPGSAVGGMRSVQG